MNILNFENLEILKMFRLKILFICLINLIVCNSRVNIEVKV